MTISPWWKIAGGVAVIVLISAFAMAWLNEHDARTKAESVQAAQQTVIVQAQQQAAAAKADQAKIASDLQAQLAAIAVQKQQPVTAPQFVVDLGKLLPNLPQPAQVVQPPVVTQTVNGKTETIQPAPAVEIPAADLPDLKAYKLDCDATSAKLAACEKTAADAASQLQASELELQAMTKDRDVWKTAAGKGTILQRLSKRVKCLGIAGGLSALGAAVDKQMPARGAAIGATAGGVGCELF